MNGGLSKSIQGEKNPIPMPMQDFLTLLASPNINWTVNTYKCGPPSVNNKLGQGWFQYHEKHKRRILLNFVVPILLHKTLFIDTTIQFFYQVVTILIPILTNNTLSFLTTQNNITPILFSHKLINSLWINLSIWCVSNIQVLLYLYSY